MGSRCTQARFLNGSPARLRSTSESELCGRCEESGLSLHDVRALDIPRIEPAPAGEELKARALKDSLTVQLYLQRGEFWDAVRELRERREITARKDLPPSGGDISAGFWPGQSPGENFGTYVLEWEADLRQITQRCVPGRFQDSADWRAFISVCVGFDPPLEALDTFTRHGDLTYWV